MRSGRGLSLIAAWGEQVDVNVVYAQRDYGLGGTAWRVVYENAAMFKALYDVTFRC